jgi:hypothetical protein
VLGAATSVAATAGALLVQQGRASQLLFLAVVALAVTLALALWLRSARTWRRVRREHAQARAQWLQWRAAVEEAGRSGRRDPRDAPLAIAVGALDAVPTSCPPTAVGIHAATRGVCESLEVLAGRSTTDLAPAVADVVSMLDRR